MYSNSHSHLGLLPERAFLHLECCHLFLCLPLLFQRFPQLPARPLVGNFMLSIPCLLPSLFSLSTIVVYGGVYFDGWSMTCVLTTGCSSGYLCCPEYIWKMLRLWTSVALVLGFTEWWEFFFIYYTVRVFIYQNSRERICNIYCFTIYMKDGFGKRYGDSRCGI